MTLRGMVLCGIVVNKQHDFFRFACDIYCEVLTDIIQKVHLSFMFLFDLYGTWFNFTSSNIVGWPTYQSLAN